MATQRFISTSFWDDAWVQQLNPTEKFFYLYLMTNPLTNIAGIYQTTLKRMVYDTGMTETAIKKVLRRFEAEGKSYYRYGYMILPNWPKHQHWDGHSNVKKGIDTILKNLPESVLQTVISTNYKYPLDSILKEYGLKDLEGASKTLTSLSNYSHSHLHLDTEKHPDIDSNPNGGTSSPSTSEIELPDPFVLIPQGEFKEALNLYVEHRKDIKKPMTERAIAIALTQLAKLPDDFARIECIQQSIMNGWQGLFPEKIHGKPHVQKPMFRTESGPEVAVEDYNYE